MSDTPRTDAEYKDHEWDIMDHIPLEFCRQLEMELNASLENQVKSMEKLVEQQDFTLKAAVLLSEAVSQRDRAIEIADEVEQCVNSWFYGVRRMEWPVFQKLKDLKTEIK